MPRVVVITGASAGIGAAIASELGRRGDSLVLAARGAEALQRVAAGLPSPTRVVTADVTRRGDVERLRDEAIAAFGHVDVWINNAGKGILRPVLELTDDDVDEMIDVNVKSALYGMQAIAPHFMERGRGHIINISSFLGRVPVATPRSAYSAAKAALNSLSANLRVDLQRTHPDVHVSVVMPGLVATDFAKNARGSTGPIPPGAVGSPMQAQTAEDVARVVAELIDRPVPEVYTNPASSAVAARYFEDVAQFERDARDR
ncbi:MAG TPA: SDR family oxidoreductase [Vicinamibacterales bacterium]|jgi:NADP-dependent 3-hydroxy acid dehydrogenase YdfG|nr:SDR family oxidoreductase [Vicinamibacterales bacterium]